MDALERALGGSRDIAAHAVIVDAVDDDARRFYAKCGFIDFPHRRRRMFLPMATIEEMFARRGSPGSR